jgi:S-adenosylmethionine/arginine decarboxylase-like enzyme
MAQEHKHLIIRAEVTAPPVDPIQTSTWLASLVEKINMKILMGPYATYCDVAGNRGLTAAVIIETSHIVLHSWDETSPAELQLDVYTCSSLNIQDIFDEISQFGVEKMEYKFLDREKGLRDALT